MTGAGPRPRWAELTMMAAVIESRGRRLGEVAASLRCVAADSVGARCTADAYPPHEHRYRDADLPRVRPLDEH